MEIGPGAFDREWHDHALHDHPELYADMTGDQIAELAGIIGAENARAIPAVLGWFEFVEGDLIAISSEAVGSEWGWNYDVTGNGDWASEDDFAKVLESDVERDAFLIIANGELGLDALEAMRDDPVRLADLASDAVENPGYVFGTERDLTDLDFFSAMNLAEYRPAPPEPTGRPLHRKGLRTKSGSATSGTTPQYRRSLERRRCGRDPLRATCRRRPSSHSRPHGRRYSRCNRSANPRAGRCWKR